LRNLFLSLGAKDLSSGAHGVCGCECVCVCVCVRARACGVCVCVCIHVQIQFVRSRTQRDTLSEVVVSLRTAVTFATWLTFRTEFLCYQVFYNTIYQSRFSCSARRKKSEVILSRVCSNTNAFATDDLAQCLSCVLLATWCAFGAHLDVGSSNQPTA